MIRGEHGPQVLVFSEERNFFVEEVPQACHDVDTSFGAGAAVVKRLDDRHGRPCPDVRLDFLPRITSDEVQGRHIHLGRALGNAGINREQGASPVEGLALNFGEAGLDIPFHTQPVE